MRSALLAVDLQWDFLPGGALAVKEGDAVVPVVRRLLDARRGLFDLAVATQDWHPPGHGSFASSHPGRRPGEVIDLFALPQILWPDHCVQGSHGAELHPDVGAERFDAVVRKGTDPRIDSYSAFFDNGRRKATELEAILRGARITDLFVGGLATDYCVLWSVRDARSLGFATHVLLDACRGIDREEGDVARAVDEMRALGAATTTSGELLAAGARSR